MVAIRVIRRLRDLDDVVTTDDPGLGSSPVDDGSGVYPLTRITTKEDVEGILDTVAHVEYHGFGLRGQPPLQGGFVNYGPSWAPARYRHNANNNVALNGLICREEPLTEQTPILTMPEGVRPDQDLVFMVPSAQSVSRVDVYADGNVVWFEHLVGDQAHVYLSLCGITFSVAPPIHPAPLPA
jgi:hypothetical protein